MKEMIKMLSRKLPQATPGPQSFNYVKPFKGHHICYKLNGYWFWLTYSQWSRYVLVSKHTIAQRDRRGRPPGECLGFVKFISIHDGKSESALAARKKNNG
jgi:hypothetical protein